MTFEAVGQGLKVTAEGVDAQGNSTNVVIGPYLYDGRSYPAPGASAFDASTYKMINGSTVEITRTKAGKVILTETRVLSTRMEDVLDLCAEEPDRKRPVVCLDESPTQPVGEVRSAIKAKPGQLERYDCGYKPNGAAKPFIVLDVHRSWRKVKVIDSRTAIDFAACMRELVDFHFPKAERIRVVPDNLSTHTAGALYQAFQPAEAGAC